MPRLSLPLRKTRTHGHSESHERTMWFRMFSLEIHLRTSPPFTSRSKVQIQQGSLLNAATHKINVDLQSSLKTLPGELLYQEDLLFLSRDSKRFALIPHKHIRVQGVPNKVTRSGPAPACCVYPKLPVTSHQVFDAQNTRRLTFALYILKSPPIRTPDVYFYRLTIFSKQPLSRGRPGPLMRG